MQVCFLLRIKLICNRKRFSVGFILSEIDSETYVIVSFFSQFYFDEKIEKSISHFILSKI